MTLDIYLKKKNNHFYTRRAPYVVAGTPFVLAGV